MANDENEEEEALDSEDGGDGQKSRSGKKWLIIGVLLFLLVAGGGAAAYFLLLAGDSKPAEATEHAAAEAPAEHGGEGSHGGAEAVPGAPVFYEMPEFLVNLSTANNKPSFLKMKVALELKSQKDVPVIEANMPRILDNFNTYLRELRATDLSGSAGMHRLREELLMRINQFVAPAQVENVLFKDIIVQ